MARPKDGPQPSTDGPVVVAEERVEPTAVSRDTPVTDSSAEHRDLGGNPPERRRPLDTPEDRMGYNSSGGETTELVYDASAPMRVTLTIYPGSRFTVANYQAAELLASSPQFRKASAADEKFPGLQAGSDSGDPEDIRPAYATGRRGAGAFDPAVVADNMPSAGDGNERSAAYAREVLKAARVVEEGIRSGRDVAATIVGPELPDEVEADSKRPARPLKEPESRPAGDRG